MITYDDSNISYGCIEYLRKKTQQNCKPKKSWMQNYISDLIQISYTEFDWTKRR